MYVIYARACACRGAWLQGEVSRRQCHGAVIVSTEACVVPVVWARARLLEEMCRNDSEPEAPTTNGMLQCTASEGKTRTTIPVRHHPLRLTSLSRTSHVRAAGTNTT